ncbi:MAG: 2-C-methyl-D-erythritol 4-phosphate cytidylyltransferase [bacterium]
MDKKVAAIITAAGKGSRMGQPISKQFLSLGGKPILYHTVKAFESSGKIAEIYLIVGYDDINYCKQKIIYKYGFQKIKKIIIGGRERQDSIYNGLKELDTAVDTVLIHDGVRPFITTELIDKIIDELDQEQAMILAVPAKDTIKLVNQDGYIKETLDRKKLCLTQTPQGFDYNIIWSAYEKAYNDGYYATDDANLVERMGKKVKILMGDYENIKITTMEDLSVAEGILRRREKSGR